MSVSPVQSYVSIGGASRADAQLPDSPSRPRVQSPADDPLQTFPPNRGKAPEQEVAPSKSDSSSSPIAEDEVQLQRDSDLENQLIVRYVDGSGNLILQVPAAQVLNLERAIAAEFQKAPAASDQTSQKGESDGH